MRRSCWSPTTPRWRHALNPHLSPKTVAGYEQAVRNDVNELIDGKLSRLRARLKSMKALEKQLLQLRSACAGERPHQSCGILKELVSAAHGEACLCHADRPASSSPTLRT